MGLAVKIWKAFLLSVQSSACSLRNVNTCLHVSRLQTDKALITALLPESILSGENSLWGLGASVFSKVKTLFAFLGYKSQTKTVGTGFSCWHRGECMLWILTLYISFLFLLELQKSHCMLSVRTQNSSPLWFCILEVNTACGEDFHSLLMKLTL